MFDNASCETTGCPFPVPSILEFRIGPGGDLPTMPDPSRDNPDRDTHLPTMPDPVEDPERGQDLPSDPDPVNKPSEIRDPLPDDEDEQPKKIA